MDFPRVRFLLALARRSLVLVVRMLLGTLVGIVLLVLVQCQIVAYLEGLVERLA
jgi:hypothetical protein